MAFICWALWKARNKDYFDNLPRDFFAVLEQGVSGWNEFRTVNDKRGGVIPPSTPPPTPIWKPPDGNCVKINVDGALSVNNYMGGLGLVARDSAGNLLGARMESLRGTFSVRTIEALGVRRALETALEWNYTHVIVEGDALQVIQALNQVKTFADCDSIVLDCLHLVSLFSSCLFTHVKRDCNRVAHSVARHSLLDVGSVCWRGIIPNGFPR